MRHPKKQKCDTCPNVVDKDKLNELVTAKGTEMLCIECLTKAVTDTRNDVADNNDWNNE